MNSYYYLLFFLIYKLLFVSGFSQLSFISSAPSLASSSPVVGERFMNKNQNDFYDSPPHREAKSILEILELDHRFTKLMYYVSKSNDLQNRFSDLKANMTVFAPTNAAFESISRIYPGKHFSEKDIERILLYHILSQMYYKSDLFHGRLIQTNLREPALEDHFQQIRVQKIDGYVLLNMYCKIEEYDINSANGLIQVVDAVLIPPPNMFEELSVFPTEFSITNTALLLTGLDKVLQSSKGITFFAPSNLAWQTLGRGRLMQLFDPARRDNLRDILLYHMSPKLLYSFDMTHKKRIEFPSALMGFVLHVSATFENGTGSRRVVLKVNNYPVIFHDGIAQNGNMHIIEKVLCPCENRIPS